MTKPVTFELSEEHAAFLAAEADHLEVTVDKVVGLLVQQRLEYDTWFRRKVEAAIESSDREKSIPHDEIVAWINELKSGLPAHKAAE
ncbi:hypothetical protein [Phenylobacterium sp.]|uniref:hypothetical protein n=1 Tax=Phenylobacterium sp. TaxID=1871053 RepID=UPI0025F85828|nr:hypothetical protein [Phenylobacterium sp.]MBX3483219.1 hypothetical protein [Phenylobacterium sp.]MCW5760136.1 hypothetical protein [Phenylobacterium sp.]